MTFASPIFLWLLLLIPFALAYAVWIRPQNLPFFRFSSLKKLGEKGTPGFRHPGLAGLGIIRVLALTLVILALARPQRGLTSEEMSTKATDIMLVLDVSRSMLTVDFKPENRFTVAKNVISEFIKGREYDRMGLVIFAQHAVTQCPLTTDKSALLNILDFVKVGTIPPDQTAVGLGIATAVNRIKDSEAKSKVIILVTDGSNNAGNIDPLTAAKTAIPFGIKIYTIGAGSPEGGLMPVPDPVFGERMVPTKSDLDEDTLLKIAGETGGEYFRAKSAGGLKTIFTEIDLMEKTEIKVKEFVDYEDLYIWFLLPALLLIFLELVFAKSIFRTVP